MILTQTIFLSFMIWSINTQNLLVTARSPTQGPAEGCFEEGIAYPGNDIGKFTRATSPEECQVDCQNRAGCVAWTFNPAITRWDRKVACFLKKKFGAQKQKKYKTSGPKYCPVTTPAPTQAPTTAAPENLSCYVTDTDYPGADIAHPKSIRSAVACQNECQTTANCAFFTFYDETSSPHYGCWLKNKQNSPITKEKCISGPRVCPARLGLGLGVRCQSYKGPPCAEPNSACITYRCKCVDEWVRYPRNGDACVEQNRLELGTPCTTPGSRCSADNSECRAFRCFCKLGFTMSAAGDECIPPLVG